MKFDFQRKLTESQIKDLADIFVNLANRIESNGAIGARLAYASRLYIAQSPQFSETRLIAYSFRVGEET
jgi:hypothetical protein